eukprot:112740_1
MANYDMTPLDVGKRMPVKVRVFNAKLSIDEIKMITILPDFNVAELKFEIESRLSIPAEHQKHLTIPSSVVSDNKEDAIPTTPTTLDDDDMKLSKFTFTKNSIITCELSDECNWKSADIAIDVSPTKPLKAVQPSPAKKKATRQTPTKGGPVQSVPVESRTTQAEQEMHFLTKHSKIQCRILIVVFEITLVLLIAYWGTINMIQYSINMVFVLIAWRGCRKLQPFWIICFLLYLVMDLIIIFLLIVLGLIEQHESVYGSTAAYVVLLSTELVLNGTWLYFYAKFFYAVLKASPRTRAMARTITSKQPILV